METKNEDADSSLKQKAIKIFTDGFVHFLILLSNIIYASAGAGALKFFALAFTFFTGHKIPALLLTLLFGAECAVFFCIAIYHNIEEVTGTCAKIHAHFLKVTREYKERKENHEILLGEIEQDHKPTPKSLYVPQRKARRRKNK